MSKPPFQVIQGDWVESAEWLTFPPLITAPTPADKTQVTQLRIARDDLMKAAGLRRRQPAYQLWSVLLGSPPPVPMHGIADPAGGLITLMDANACFRGLKRPCAGDDLGDGLIAYALKPEWFFAYEFRAPVLLAAKERVPPDLVFMAYAKLDVPPGETVSGVLTHWEFVNADQEEPLLPADWKSRYVEKLW